MGAEAILANSGVSTALHVSQGQQVEKGDSSLSKVDSLGAQFRDTLLKILGLRTSNQSKDGGVIWFGVGGYAFLPLLPLLVVLITITMIWEALLQGCISLLRPTGLPQKLADLFDDFVTSAAHLMLREPEKHKDFLYTHCLLLLIPPAFVGALYIEVFVNSGSWWLSVAVFVFYHVLRMGPYFRFFAYLHAMVHMEGHTLPRERWFKPPFRILNRSIEYCIFLFYGGVPENYAVGHRIHHSYLNGFNDVHSNIEYSRSSVRQFSDFLIKFALFWSGISVVKHLHEQNQMPQKWRMLQGMGIFASFLGIVAFINLRFALFYVVYPFVEAVFMLGAVAYTWHAFIDPDDPTNEYVTSITILEGQYNVFNADYHVVHHDHPNMYYKDMPKVFQRDIHLYKSNKATIFRDTQTFEIFFLIVTGNVDRLASLFVDLDTDNPMTHQQKKELLCKRLAIHRPPTLGWAPKSITLEEENQWSLVTLRRRLLGGGVRSGRAIDLLEDGDSPNHKNELYH